MSGNLTWPATLPPGAYDGVLPFVIGIKSAETEAADVIVKSEEMVRAKMTEVAKMVKMVRLKMRE